TANRDVALVRYLPDGSLDPSFGANGRVTVPVGTGNDEATAVALQGDGKVVVTGYAVDGTNYDVMVGRFTSGGVPDPSFNGTGFRRLSAGDGVEQGNAIVVQPDGKLLVAGQTKVSGTARFALARVNPDGTPDATFAGGGVTTTAIGELAE